MTNRLLHLWFPDSAPRSRKWSGRQTNSGQLEADPLNVPQGFGGTLKCQSDSAV